MAVEVRSTDPAEAPIHVMVADDDRCTRQAVKAILAARGFVVHTAADGPEALDGILTGEADILVTDYEMPTMSGLALMHAVHEHFPLLPVVVLTAHSDLDLALTAMRAGAADFVTKPPDARALAAALDRASRHARRLRHLRFGGGEGTVLEQALQRQIAFQQQLLDAIPVPVFYKNRDGRFLGCNQAYVELVGRPRSDVLGHTTQEVLPPALAELELRRDEEIFGTGGQQVFEVDTEQHGTAFASAEVHRATYNDEAGDVAGLVGTIFDITERKRAHQQLELLAIAVHSAAEAIVVTDPQAIIQYVNPAFEDLTGWTAADAVGQSMRILKSGQHSGEFYRELWQTISSGKTWRGRVTDRRRDGDFFEHDGAISPVRDEAGTIVSYVAAMRDVTEVAQLQSQLLQAQKLEAVGQLAAGIAHEINTPTQYVGDNITFLHESFDGLLRLLEAYAELRQAAEGKVEASVLEAVDQTADEVDLEYLREEIPTAFEQSADGVQRVTKIVRAMKEFSHPGVEELTPFDLNRGIESTVTVARNEWKYVSDLTCDFDDNLPLVPCLPGEFNQVILNLVINAAHAIAGVVGDGGNGKGRITVSTRLDGEWVEVRVADTGGGIPEAVQQRVFEPFFTTKEVGKGTGQGLAIARSVVVDKLGGSIDFETADGHGTTFIIRLPSTAEAPSEAQLEAAG